FVSFGAFFFGVSFGLEEICKEFAILFRERMVGLGVVPYVLSKLAILVPVLVVVSLIMIGLLRATDRLPNRGLELYTQLAITVFLTAWVGLTLGLLASAAVRSPEQAAIVLPGLILPQVLFSGAFLPVPAMGQL